MKLKVNGKYRNFTSDTVSPVTILPNEPILYDQKERKADHLKKDTEMLTKTNQIPWKNYSKHRVQRRNHKITNTYHSTKRCHTIIKCELVETSTNCRQQNSTGWNNHPIKSQPLKIQQNVWNEPHNQKHRKIQIKPGCYPIQQKATPIPYHLQQDVNKPRTAKVGAISKAQNLNGGPFGLCETPAGCKKFFKKLKGGPFGDMKNFQKFPKKTF